MKDFDLENIDYNLLEQIISHSVDVKKYFVANDLTENNIRKALNFGHTFGHAFESLAMEQNRPVLHGYAVAYGMMAELFLSLERCKFPVNDFKELTNWLLEIYGDFRIKEDDFERVYELMTHDKKNESGRINFTLLTKTGEIQINQNCEKTLIFKALDYFRTIKA